jgi:TonB family protein
MTKLHTFLITLFLISGNLKAHPILIGIGSSDTTINKILKNGLFAEYQYVNGVMKKKTYYYRQMKLSSYDVNIESATQINISKAYFSDSVFKIYKAYADTVFKSYKTPEDTITNIKEYLYANHAHFIGEGNSLNNFLEENLVYPEKAKKKNKTGVVFVLFDISKEGVISSIKSDSNIDPELIREAYRVINKTDGYWVPMSLGQRCRIPITFDLD